MDEESANFGGVMARVEEIVVAVGPLIGAVEGLALAPSTTGDDERLRRRFGWAMLDDQIGAVGNELGIDTEDGGQRAFHLRGRVILGLEAADGGVDERAEDGKVGEKGGADAEAEAEAGGHDGLVQIVTAKGRDAFSYLHGGRGGYDAGAALAVRNGREEMGCGLRSR